MSSFVPVSPSTNDGPTLLQLLQKRRNTYATHVPQLKDIAGTALVSSICTLKPDMFALVYLDTAQVDQHGKNGTIVLFRSMSLIYCISSASCILLTRMCFKTAIALYSKGGGTHGKHAWTAEVDAITKVSYAVGQLYWFSASESDTTRSVFREQWRLTGQQTRDTIKRFQHLPSTQIICMLGPLSLLKDKDGVLMAATYTTNHTILSVMSTPISKMRLAIGEFRKRKQKAAEVQIEAEEMSDNQQ